MELEKRYVPVTVHFDAGGKMRPIEIEFDETRKYHIDKILDVRRAACQRCLMPSIRPISSTVIPPT